MKIIVTGSLGHISKPLTQRLIEKGHQVTVISRSAEREKDIAALGASAAIGSIADKDFLTRTFTGADLVYTMLPPGPMNQSADLDDLMAKVETIVRNYAQAIRNAGVRRVIHLSSIGAHTDQGNGLLRLHYLAESVLKELPADVHLIFMRPTGFYYNLYAYIEMIKNSGFIASNYGEEDLAIWVSPVDIAAATAEEIDNPPSANHAIRYVASEEIACRETASILGKAIGKPDLKWIIIPDEQMLDGLISRGMKPDIASAFVEMYASNNRGTIYEDYDGNRPELGKIKMADFAKEFAAVYHQK